MSQLNSQASGRWLLNGTLLVITLAYPFLIYFGLSQVPLGVFVTLLVALFILRAWVARGTPSAAWIGPLAIAGLIFCALVWLTSSEQLLLFYPVLINLLMLIIFAASLFKPPSVIERLARLTQPDLPAAGVRYTRKVTLVWCFFFASTA